MLYPFVFKPILKERLWGGRNLASLYGKPLPPDVPIGESWEISDRPGDVSVIENGRLAGKDLRWLMEHHREQLMGTATPLQGRFPLLVKILDAREILSVQVHPPDKIAGELGGEPKTELWYVTQAEAGAALRVGLRPGVTRADFERRLRDGAVDQCIHQVPVKAGDAMFLPSGRIHALGANLVIFEVQQNSDTTYRVFDWNRLGPDGKARELHVDQALACIDFEDFKPGLVQAAWREDGKVQHQVLVDHPLFTVKETRAVEATQLTWSGHQPAILGVVSGSINLTHRASGETLELRSGGFSLLPVEASGVEMGMTGQTTFLTATLGTRA